MNDRISRHEMFMRMAEVVAQRATCPRKKVGVLIADNELLNVRAIGYNGQPTGFPHICRYTEPGNCGCTHAEVNALIKAPYGAGPLRMFCSSYSPCEACARLIVNSDVTMVYYREEYRLRDGLDILWRGQVRFVHLREEEIWQAATKPTLLEQHPRRPSGPQCPPRSVAEKQHDVLEPDPSDGPDAA
jgi:dCMP deaminase